MADMMGSDKVLSAAPRELCREVVDGPHIFTDTIRGHVQVTMRVTEALWLRVFQVITEEIGPKSLQCICSQCPGRVPLGEWGDCPRCAAKHYWGPKR